VSNFQQGIRLGSWKEAWGFLTQLDEQIKTLVTGTKVLAQAQKCKDVNTG